MRFYRLATADDMNQKKVQFEASIPLAVRDSCYQDGQAAAAKRWSNQSSITLTNANAKLREYQAFQNAFADFSAGKPIYTDY